MTAITPGIEGTLKSVSAEKALFEVFTILRSAEKNPAKNTSNVNYLSATISFASFVISISFNIPALYTITSSGSINIEANEYLSGLNFQPGADGTFKSNKAAQTLLEIVSYLQSKEASSNANPDNKNLVTSSYDADSSVFNGTATLSFTPSLDNNGNTILSINDYLL